MTTRSTSPRQAISRSPAAPPLLRIALLGAAVLGCLLALNSASRALEAIPAIKAAPIKSAEYQRARDAAFAKSDAATEGWLQLRVLLSAAPALLPGPKATLEPPATQPTIPARRDKQFQTAFTNLTAAQQQTRSIGPLRLVQAALILSQLETIDRARPWWPYIKPNLSGIDPAALTFEMGALRQALVDAYVSLGIDPGGAAEFAEEFIGSYAANFMAFLTPRLTTIALECEASGDAECAEICRQILFTQLRRMILEDPLPADRLVAADRLATVLEGDLGKSVPDREAIAAGLRRWRNAYHEYARAAPAGPLTLNGNVPDRAPSEDSAAANAIIATLWLAVATASLGVAAFLVTLLSVFSRIASVLAKAGDPANSGGVLRRSIVAALVGVVLIGGVGYARSAPASRNDDLRQVIIWKTAKHPPKAKGQGHWLPHYRVTFLEPAITAAIVGVLAMRFVWIGRGLAGRAMAGTAAAICISVVLLGIATAAVGSTALSRIDDYDAALVQAIDDPTMGLGSADANLAPLRAWKP